MYPIYAGELVDGKEVFPYPWIVAENLLYLATWTLAGVLLWPVWRIGHLSISGAGWIALVLSVQIVLKKHNCSGCFYYGRRCHLGWGKLAAMMFKENSGSPLLGQHLSLFYVLTPPAVVLTGIARLALGYSGWLYGAVLGLYVVLNALTFPVRRLACRACRMRKVCPGSAARG